MQQGEYLSTEQWSRSESRWPQGQNSPNYGLSARYRSKPHKKSHNHNLRSWNCGSHDLQHSPSCKFTCSPVSSLSLVCREHVQSCFPIGPAPAHNIPKGIPANHPLSAEYDYPYKTTLHYPFKTAHVLRNYLVLPLRNCDTACYYPFEIENFHASDKKCMGARFKWTCVMSRKKLAIPG